MTTEMIIVKTIAMSTEIEKNTGMITVTNIVVIIETEKIIGNTPYLLTSLQLLNNYVVGHVLAITVKYVIETEIANENAREKETEKGTGKEKERGIEIEIGTETGSTTPTEVTGQVETCTLLPVDIGII